VVVLDPLLEFSFSFNPGSAFGLLGTVSWARTFFIATTVLALGYIGWLAATLPTRARTGFVGVGLVAAGALGNLHDRLVRADELGRYGVDDFIQINYPWDTSNSWPTFNVADLLLLVGIGLVLIAVPSRGRAAAPTAPSSATTSEP
jgi:signal peptidase II